MKQEVLDYFSHKLEQVWEQYQTKDNVLRLEFIASAVNKIPADAPSKALDLGAGFGHFSQYLSGSPYNFEAIDAVEPNEDMVLRGQQELSLENVSWHICALPDLNVDLRKQRNA